MPKSSLITDATLAQAADWRKAKPSLLGASSGLESGSQSFWARLSDLEFGRFTQLIETTLVAHGFELNLENMLFCLENMVIGRRVEWFDEHESQRVKKYESVLSFDLPRRGRSGSLLQMFYGLIDSFGAKNSSSLNTPEVENALKRKVQDLEKKNSALQAELEIMRSKIEDESFLHIKMAKMDQALSAFNQTHQSSRSERLGALDRLVLPGSQVQIRLEFGTVKEINHAKNLILVKVGKKVFELSFESLFAFPSASSQGIALLGDEGLIAFYPIGESWSSFAYRSALVIAHQRNSGVIKLRLGDGSEFIWKVTKSQRQTSIQMKRNDAIVAQIANHRLIGIFPQEFASPKLRDLEIEQRFLAAVERLQ